MPGPSLRVPGAASPGSDAPWGWGISSPSQQSQGVLSQKDTSPDTPSSLPRLPARASSKPWRQAGRVLSDSSRGWPAVIALLRRARIYHRLARRAPIVQGLFIPPGF